MNAKNCAQCGDEITTAKSPTVLANRVYCGLICSFLSKAVCPPNFTDMEWIISNIEIDSISGCWLWQRNISPEGYGKLYRKGTKQYVHRAAYAEANGHIPNGMDIDHLCRTRSCCNPDHLEAVPHRVNVLRGISPGAIVTRTNTCLRGHEFTPENTYITPDGTRRQCRACSQIRERRKTAKARAARRSLNQIPDAS